MEHYRLPDAHTDSYPPYRIDESSGYPPRSTYPTNWIDESSGYPDSTYPTNWNDESSGYPVWIYPGIPLHANIGSLLVGQSVVITGRPISYANHFTVNLRCGPPRESDYALHLDVRFDYMGDRDCIVRNHKENGTWGYEDKDGDFPFFPTEPFVLKIEVHETHFMIYVGATYSTPFYHRIQPIEAIDSVYIEHDVEVKEVRVQPMEVSTACY